MLEKEAEGEPRSARRQPALPGVCGGGCPRTPTATSNLGMLAMDARRERRGPVSSWMRPRPSPCRRASAAPVQPGAALSQSARELDAARVDELPRYHHEHVKGWIFKGDILMKPQEGNAGRQGLLPAHPGMDTGNVQGKHNIVRGVNSRERAPARGARCLRGDGWHGAARGVRAPPPEHVRGQRGGQ
ncbi:unnamed protein product [Arctogadus glacialis]